MSQEILKKKLGTIGVLVGECLAILGDNSSPNSPIPKASQKGRKSKKGAGSTGPIKTLIDGGFFKQPKTDIETQAALKKRAAHFERNAIAVTLMRLVQNSLLEREGGGTKTNPWKYKSL
jgi:hypothetical protein